MALPITQQENLHSTNGRHQNPLPHQISNEQKALNADAHREADKDIEADAEISVHSPNDNLNEGETAKLGEDVPV